MCLYIRDSLCQNIATRKKICNPDLEQLCITLRPHYLPREFTKKFVCLVHILPSGNANREVKQITDCIHHLLQSNPDAPMLILGDFNHCSLTKTLPGFISM